MSSSIKIGVGEGIDGHTAFGPEGYPYIIFRLAEQGRYLHIVYHKGQVDESFGISVGKIELLPVLESDDHGGGFQSPVYGHGIGQEVAHEAHSGFGVALEHQVVDGIEVYSAAQHVRGCEECVGGYGVVEVVGVGQDTCGNGGEGGEVQSPGIVGCRPETHQGTVEQLAGR